MGCGPCSMADGKTRSWAALSFHEEPTMSPTGGAVLIYALSG